MGRRLRFLLALALAAGAACGGDTGRAGDAGGTGEGDAAARATAASESPAVDSAAVDSAAVDPAGSAGPGPDRVEVWLTRGEEPVAVERRVGDPGLEAALRELVAGPTAEERAAGLSSWFSDSTRQALREVTLEDGFAVVDLTGLPERIPGATSSAGSQQLLTVLDSTVFQFEGVDSVEYRLDGSCQAFWEWLQRGCEVVRRSS